MNAEKVLTGIIVTVFTGTVSTLIGGIILNSLERSISTPSPATREHEKKAVPPVVVPVPPRAQPEIKPAAAPVPPVVVSVSLPAQPEIKPAATEYEKKAASFVIAPVPLPTQPEMKPAVAPVRPSETQPLLDRLIEQRNEIERLKRAFEKLERDSLSKREVPLPTPSREPKIPSQMNSMPLPEPARIRLFYRVASQRTKQVESKDLDEMLNLLKSLKLPYTRGPSYKDIGWGPLYTPIGIRKTASWRTCDAKSIAHRDRLTTKLLALGIEATADKPEEFDE
jgi:hypothetical protein